MSIRIALITALICSWSEIALAQEPVRLKIHVTDLQGRPIEKIQLTTAGTGSVSLPTTALGDTQLYLDPRSDVGTAVSLVVLDSSQWVMITPQIIVPRLKESRPVRIQVMRRDRFRVLMTGALKKLSLARGENEELSSEQRQAILEEYARSRGLSKPQLDRAIRSFQDTDDAFDQGLARLILGQYPEAEGSLEKAYHARRDAYDRASEDLVSVSRILGQAMTKISQREGRLAALELERKIRIELKGITGGTHEDPLKQVNLLRPEIQANADLTALQKLYETIHRALEVALNDRYPGVLEALRRHAGELTALGDASAKAGELDEAVRYYLRAMELDPRDARILARLCAVLRDQGQTEKADHACRLARRNDDSTSGPS